MNWENLNKEKCPICEGKLHLRVKHKRKKIGERDDFGDRLWTCGTRNCEFTITQGRLNMLVRKNSYNPFLNGENWREKYK